jgi:hypothetical protein
MTTRNLLLGVLVLAVQAFTSLSVAAQIGDSAFRYFLVPLMVTGPPETGADPLPGAHGSLWSSRLLAFNEGDKPIELTIGGDHCAFICFGPTFWVIHPEQVLSLDGVWLDRPAGLNGILFYLRNDQARVVRWNLRVFDVSRADTTWGTEIPVISQNEALTGRAQLLDVPLLDGFRSSVRIYSLQEQGAVTAVVRVYSNETGERLARVPVTLSPARPLHTATSSFPAEPGFAYIPDLRELAGTDETSVRVEIAFPPGLKFWTFASVTHNETQHVTIVTP